MDVGDEGYLRNVLKSPDLAQHLAQFLTSEDQKNLSQTSKSSGGRNCDI